MSAIKLSYISCTFSRILTVFFILSLNCYEVFAQNQTKNKELQQVYEYYQVDKLPKYEGTSDFKPALDSNLEWPEPFHGEGRVILSFVVSTDGKIRYIQILRGLCEPCDDNAISAITKLSEWTPGEINGQAVSTRMYVSVNSAFDTNQILSLRDPPHNKRINWGRGRYFD